MELKDVWGHCGYVTCETCEEVKLCEITENGDMICEDCFCKANEKPDPRPGADPKPVGKCPKCGIDWYSTEGFCGGCKPAL